MYLSSAGREQHGKTKGGDNNGEKLHDCTRRLRLGMDDLILWGIESSLEIRFVRGRIVFCISRLIFFVLLY